MYLESYISVNKFDSIGVFDSCFLILLNNFVTYLWFRSQNFRKVTDSGTLKNSTVPFALVSIHFLNQKKNLKMKKLRIFVFFSTFSLHPFLTFAA